ncbi:DUF6228 family protein [Pseudarthrobacter chlorophenolicus]|uniref:DUF6228 family protein n=1 Tax=Pseudarthrobacter chlorophenolicus TaxID=85085 RepID=UPI0006991E82|nr:DUF6228 family protein [Pseudarthrobacter chlorophenolicus]
MDKVDIGGTQRLTFGDLRRDPCGQVLAMTVTVELESLTARREVAASYVSGFADLAGFFTSLLENWRGWNGARTYKSIEHDLLLEATHTGSHVELLFNLQDPQFHDVWSVRGKLTLDAGEELTRAGEDIQELFRPLKGAVL